MSIENYMVLTSIPRYDLWNQNKLELRLFSVQLRFSLNYRIAIGNLRKINGTLGGLQFCVRINSEMISGRNKGPLRAHGRNYPYRVNLKFINLDFWYFNVN